MQENNNTIRIHTDVGTNSPNVINVPLNQSFDTFEILSLKLTQKNEYSFYESTYGVIVGRVLANDAFGIPNAKISIFIPAEDGESMLTKGIYPYTSVRSSDNDGIRYNLLPDEQVNVCHQNVGTFPNKRLVLDNNDIIEIFDKYWKYTTVTNESGDYMIFGVPIGDQQLHVDIDLSDIGVLSQRPRDMIYKGYNANMFESPNKFKQSKNLDSLAQIYSQNKGIYVYPYWGDTSNTEDTVAITRCDIQIEYKFEPTCIFMGCIITDQGENAIGKNCAAVEKNGRMENLTSGEGTIEMIRKTIDGKVEEYQINGNRLIDSDGVWCYQIPMNLDYVKTDEYGNIVATDDPNKGIPTRARVRFRITLDETPNDATARKRCSYLVPNNPSMDSRDYPIFNQTKEFDYDFGTLTRDEDYRDLFMNKVYTVKNYIPRIQKGSKENNKKHTGIKAVNFYGTNNPFPYNSLLIKLSFTYRIICILVKFILYFVSMLNFIFSTITSILYPLYAVIKGLDKFSIVGVHPLRPITGPLLTILDALMIECIGFGSDFCDDGVNKIKYFLGCWGFGCTKTKEEHDKEQKGKPSSERERAICTDLLDASDTTLFTCIEQQLANDNDCVDFNFYNDWINGALYAPLWYRKITPKKSFLFGLFKKKAKDQWCSADRSSGGAQIFMPCAIKRNADGTYTNNDGDNKSMVTNIGSKNQCDNCLSSTASSNIVNGVIKTKETLTGATAYYYQAGEYQPQLNNNKGEILTLFATDIVLLGSLDDCDSNGMPQFFKYLTSTTYNMPNNILVIDGDIEYDIDDEGNFYEKSYTAKTEATGCDWGNTNTQDEYRKDYDGGLFYGIGCSTIESKSKSCINLSRICEFGVTLDETKYIENLNSQNDNDESDYFDNLLIPDGYVSYDEIMNEDARSMFATLNGNHLRTKINNKSGLYEYDLRYYCIDNFDGAMKDLMSSELQGIPTSKNITYKNNYVLEKQSKDYYHFRMGDRPFFYDRENRFPKYDNSFYFYFGIHPGNTAIEKFNSQFFSSCENSSDSESAVTLETKGNSWCDDSDDGYIKINFNGISTPYTLTIVNDDETLLSESFVSINSEKVYLSTTDKPNLDQDGYEYLTNGTSYTLANADYTITVTDNDGNVSTIHVSLNNKYLSYSTFVENFNEANNILMSEYGSYEAIANKAVANTQLSNKDVVGSEIGGVIGLYDIYQDNEPFDGVLRIEITSTTNFYNGAQWSQTCISNGTLPNNVHLEHYSVEDENGDTIQMPYYIIGVPKGGETYNITVRQLCDGDDSMNFMTTTVRVDEPKPFKLYINDVDYDVIKRFKTGYTPSGSNANVDGTTPVGWLDVTDETNYDWEANDMYTTAYYINKGQTEEEAEESVRTAKNELIETMKSRFMLRCEGNPFSLSIRIEAENVPYDVKVGYIEEEDGGNDYDYNVIADCGYQIDDITLINDISIPTITSIDNAIYGNDKNKVPGRSDLCYSLDPVANCVKRPYFVAVCDSKGNTIPRENISITDKNTLTDSKMNNYFGIHVIDKTMRLRCVAWAYMNNIPCYKANGDSGPLNGFFSGILYNGISTSEDTMAIFSEQTFGSRKLSIKTYTLKDGAPDENAIPTKRVIVGGNDGETAYKRYIIPNTVNEPTYASVDNESIRLTIKDEACEMGEDIYGDMYIAVDTDKSIIDARYPKNTTLAVTAKNSGDDVRYYIISFDNNYGYVYNKLKTNQIGGYDDYGYMKFEFTEDQIKELSQSDNVFLSLWSEHQSDNGGNDMVSEQGWGTTGVFTPYIKEFSESLSPKFIIAISGVTRCLSPVYEFIFYNAGISVTGSLDGGSEITFNIINGNDSYYLTNYEYSLNVFADTVIGDKAVQIDQDIDNINSGEYDHQIEGDIADNLFQSLKQIVDAYKDESGAKDDTAAKKIIAAVLQISVIDATGLNHICKIDTENVHFTDNTPETSEPPATEG